MIRFTVISDSELMVSKEALDLKVIRDELDFT